MSNGFVSSQNMSGLHFYFDLVNETGATKYFTEDFTKVLDSKIPLINRVQEVALFVIKGATLAAVSIPALLLVSTAGFLRNSVLVVMDVSRTLLQIKHAATNPAGMTHLEQSFYAVAGRVALIGADWTTFTWCYPVAVAYGFFPQKVEQWFLKLEKFATFMPDPKPT